MNKIEEMLLEHKFANVLSAWHRIRTEKALRRCTAVVKENEQYAILKSFNTIVAFIDKRENRLYDVLRYVYGYTATSAQHIRKFYRDYGNSTTEYIRID